MTNAQWKPALLIGHWCLGIGHLLVIEAWSLGLLEDRRYNDRALTPPPALGRGRRRHSIQAGPTVRRTNRQSRGFSLPELLVVVGIAAVLMSMLLPALGKAREQARRAQCLTNLRTLTTAWLAYAHANGGRLCRASAGRPDRPGFYDWVASADPKDALSEGV